MNIADIASPEFAEVEVDDRFGKVRALFERENPKGVIVIEADAYRGVLTERQILQSHVNEDTRVDALMRSAPKVERTDDVRDVSRMLVEGDTKVAPVFEADDLWGIITVDAILRAVLENLDALTVDQILTEEVISIAGDTTIGQAINLLREHGISRLPVVDDGLLSGIVTTHDLSDVIIRDMDKPTRGDRGGERDRMLDLPIYDAMSNPVETVPDGATVREAAELMLEHDYAGLVVTPADDNRLIRGVITKTDILRALSYTEEEHMDVQITNIDLIDSLTRVYIRESITDVADKFQDMQVQHAHVRFHEHKEKLRGVSLIDCKIRLRTNSGQIAGSGEGYGADAAFHVALDKLERNVLERKGVKRDEEYRGQLLRKLGDL